MAVSPGRIPGLISLDPLLVVLDLDETLVHSPHAALTDPPAFALGTYSVYVRPFLKVFLQEVFSKYLVAIWTAAGCEFAEGVVANIVAPESPLQFLWSAECCTQRFDRETREHFTVKKLRKIRKKGYDLARVLVIDDSPEKHMLNYGNLVQVVPFTGDSTDAELLRLLPYLEWINTEANVRAIDKRNWRDHVRGCPTHAPRRTDP